MPKLLKTCSLIFCIFVFGFVLMWLIPELAYLGVPLLLAVLVFGWRRLRSTLDEVAFHDVSDGLAHETQDRIANL
jgi:uncharacterized membrane protein YciS (DUF1049 family)